MLQQKRQHLEGLNLQLDLVPRFAEFARAQIYLISAETQQVGGFVPW